MRVGYVKYFRVFLLFHRCKDTENFLTVAFFLQNCKTTIGAKVTLYEKNRHHNATL